MGEQRVAMAEIKGMVQDREHWKKDRLGRKQGTLELSASAGRTYRWRHVLANLEFRRGVNISDF